MSFRSGGIEAFSFEPRLPGDKSITHRAYILGALARGETRVLHPNTGADCRGTLDALRTLGVKIEAGEEAVILQGLDGRFHEPGIPLDLGNSGTGLRLLLGMLAAQPLEVILTGDGSLRRRPVERILAPLRLMGAHAQGPGDHPPVSLRGGELHGIAYDLPVPSAQIKSALLLAGVQARGRTRIRGGGTSRDHTERMLPAFGGVLEGTGDDIAIEGPQHLSGTEIAVPGDISAAMFYLAAAVVVPGSRVTFSSVGQNPTRTGALAFLERLGLTLETEIADPKSPEPSGRLAAISKSTGSITVESADVPGVIDELPALAVAAAFAGGESFFRGAGELRVKESNRLEAVAEGLWAIGAEVELLEDGWRIHGSGGERLPGGPVVSRGDHRVAMAFLVAGLGCRNGVEIVDAPGIDTSDPYFISNLKSLETSR